MWSSSRASAKKKIILHTFERSSLAFGHIILFAKNIKVSDGRAFISNQITRRTLFPLSNLGCILNVPYQLGRTIRKAAIRHVEERDFILKRPCQPEVKRKVFLKNTYVYVHLMLFAHFSALVPIPKQFNQAFSKPPRFDFYQLQGSF